MGENRVMKVGKRVKSREVRKEGGVYSRVMFYEYAYTKSL